MLRLIIWLALIGGFVWFGSNVELGKRTLFGHVRAIWHTEQVQDLKDGVKDKAGPAVDRLERGIKAGYKAATGDGAGSDLGSGGSRPAGSAGWSSANRGNGGGT